MSDLPVDPNAAVLYRDALGKSVIRQLSVVDVFKTTQSLEAMGQKPLALDLYKNWVAHNGQHDLLYAVYFNYGVALMASGDKAGAILAYKEAIRLKPDFYSPYINLGRAFEDSGQAGQAVTQWLELVNKLSGVNGDTVTHKLTVLQQIGRVLEAANSDPAAEDALRQSIDIDPRQIKVVQHWISLRQRQCKWPAIQPWERATKKHLLAGISSLSLSCLADDPLFQLSKSFHYARHTIGLQKPVARHVPPARAEQRRLRICYISSDLREHAVGFGMTDVLEQHDRENFEIFAYYCGIDRTDPTQQRAMKAVDHWTDISRMSDDDAAAKIAADGIDIVIDLNGYTKDARTEVFARRPAPIAVNWFGFPGTMGTPYHHYIVADPHIIPAGSEIYYSEKVLRMPCYQPNDRKRPVAENRPTRAEVGLPPDAFVYCSFNGAQKTTPRVFKRWMEILTRVPNSVLWLLSATPEVNDRLRTLAGEHGVSPARLIFAEKRANPDHLARYPLADLFLDSLPYGAHTTAADALWMNVPILTFAGRSFASRVCASLVHAAGVGELEATSAAHYVEEAVAYGLDRARLNAVKAKLAANRDTCRLFNTPELVGDLENLYRQMWADYTGGKLPQPDLRNLEVYHEVGLELDVEEFDAVSDDAYLAAYVAKLDAWNESYPLGADSRLLGADEAAATAVSSGRKVA